MVHGCCRDGKCDETTCMTLPDGKTCGNCFHISRCQAMFGRVPVDTNCDWFPRRFVDVEEHRLRQIKIKIKVLAKAMAQENFSVTPEEILACFSGQLLSEEECYQIMAL